MLPSNLFVCVVWILEGANDNNNSDKAHKMSYG